ncbi:hypothetical protein HYC85_009196 [Camellia sinensis]|uniref:Peptidase A1 domain-containing protein n=1 Tax=Camellia sinensis TaxID=4442 RepID=A0A7J7HEB0_CAMSI|nr:hypothetical protein HYC85_009196 [Camellia sinensis]
MKEKKTYKRRREKRETRSCRSREVKELHKKASQISLRSGMGQALRPKKNTINTGSSVKGRVMATIVTTFYSLSFSIFAILVSIIFLSMFSLIEANNFGFSVDLIHRDSPDSPFYNSSLTHFDRVIKALRRSHSRVNYFTSASMSPQSASSEVIPSDGSYLMKITVGTPPFNILAIADTGSDLTWTQCLPCRNCYKQKLLPLILKVLQRTKRSLVIQTYAKRQMQEVLAITMKLASTHFHMVICPTVKVLLPLIQSPWVRLMANQHPFQG